MILIKLPESEALSMKKTFTPPIGLWSMRENNPLISQVFDGHLEGLPDTLSFINSLSPTEEIGFSVQFHTQEEAALHLAQYIEGSLIVGGPHGSTLSSSLFTTHKGPGESKSFTNLKPPHFTEEEMNPYWKKQAPFGLKSKRKWFPIETSRGCPNRCDFCMMGSFWGPWRGRSLDVLEEYISYLQKEHQIEELIVLDDNISLIKERFLATIELFNRYKVSWSCPNGIYLKSLLDPQVLKALRTSTCSSLSLPFETANEDTARWMGIDRKFLSLAEARWLVNELYPIELTGFFIIGYPGEDAAAVQRTLDFANSLPLQERHIYFATPYPGSSLHKRCEDNGWLRKGVSTYRSALIDTPWLSQRALIDIFEIDRKEHSR